MNRERIKKEAIDPSQVAYVVPHSGWIALLSGEHLNPLYYKVRELSPPPQGKQ